MRLVTRILALSRATRLKRQLHEIEHGIQQLPMPACQLLAELVSKECAAAERTAAPHLHGSPPDLKTDAWGTGTDLGYERSRSDNAQVRLRGMALWLAVAYHETAQSGFAEFADLHREVLRVMRQLKETAAQPLDRTAAWMNTESGAAA